MPGPKLLSVGARHEHHGIAGSVLINIAEVLVEILPPEVNLLILIVEDLDTCAPEVCGYLVDVLPVLTSEGKCDVVSHRSSFSVGHEHARIHAEVPGERTHVLRT